MTRKKWLVDPALLLLFLTSSILCAQSPSLKGAGATFPAPIYRKWIEAFEQRHPGMPVSYEAIGSGQGMRRLQAGAVDFAASDILLTAEKQQDLDVQLFPMVIGAVVPAYNLPHFERDLRFTADVLADIFAGKIKAWDDPRLRALNREAKLPALDIAVVHRSDESGTTFAFTDFLSKTVPAWRAGLGTGSVLRWATGEGVEGNEGISQAIQRKPGSIGYVEFIYAVHEHLNYGEVRNASNKFVRADIDSLTAAAADEGARANDSRVSLTNSEGSRSYPICSFTWLVVPNHWRDAAKRDRMTSLLAWALSSGQRQAAALGYVAIPEAMADRERSLLNVWKSRATSSH